MIFEKLPNTRDLADVPLSGGRQIRPGMLIRSGMLYAASEQDIRTLAQLPVTLILDFRSDQECIEKPDPAIPGAEYLNIAPFRDTISGITRDIRSDARMMEQLKNPVKADPDIAIRYMTTLYREMGRNPDVHSCYHRFFELLLQNRSGATLWHCTAGKDRAGFAAILLLAALGADRDAILADYLRTNENVQHEIAYIIKAEKLEGLPAEETVRAFFGARQEYLNALFESINGVYGGMKEFLKNQIGVTDEMQKALLERFTV